jgi:DNA polymerase III subunit delta
MARFDPAYLIHGDDHGRIAERRARLRALAERESGVGGVELFENETSAPETVAFALDAMTFAIGRRFLIVEGVERWKDKEMAPLVTALGAMAPDTTVAFFAREDGRAKAPDALHKAVKKAGGRIDVEQSVKPWELPKWVIAQARELGIELDSSAAHALIGHVGERQQRLMRELEKLALGAEPGASFDASEVDELTAASAERRAWSLADAIVAGDLDASVRIYLTLRTQGERVSGLLYWMAQRVRSALEIAQAIDDGEPVAQIKRRLRMPQRAADRLIADARQAGGERLRTALEQIADLEVASRGGGPGGQSEDTSALRTITLVAG